MTKPDIALVYVGDPMCSWCWGFAPVLERLDARFDFPVEVVAGGLRPGEAAEELDDRMRRFLLHHWTEIEERTGQPFNMTALDRQDWRYDTMTADTAVVAMRNLNPDRTLGFFNRLQRAFYAEAVDVTNPAVYVDLVEGFDVDGDEFFALLTSEEMARETWGDFAASQRLGVTGFPTLFLREDTNAYLVIRGYAPYEPIEEGLMAFIEERYPETAGTLVHHGGGIS